MWMKSVFRNIYVYPLFSFCPSEWMMGATRYSVVFNVTTQVAAAGLPLSRSDVWWKNYPFPFFFFFLESSSLPLCSLRPSFFNLFFPHTPTFHISSSVSAHLGCQTEQDEKWESSSSAAPTDRKVGVCWCGWRCIYIYQTHMWKVIIGI